MRGRMTPYEILSEAIDQIPEDLDARALLMGDYEDAWGHPDVEAHLRIAVGMSRHGFALACLLQLRMAMEIRAELCQRCKGKCQLDHSLRHGSFRRTCPVCHGTGRSRHGLDHAEV